MLFFILYFVRFVRFKRHCAYINLIEIKKNSVIRSGVGALSGSDYFLLTPQIYSYLFLNEYFVIYLKWKLNFHY